MDRIGMPMGAVTRAAYDRPCDRCGGRGGETVTETTGSTTRQTWKSCGACGGRGRR